MEKFTSILSSFILRDTTPIVADYVGSICSHIVNVNGLDFPMYILSDKFIQSDISARPYNNPVSDYMGNSYSLILNESSYFKYTHFDGVMTFAVPYNRNNPVENILHDNGMAIMFVRNGWLWIVYEKFGTNEELIYTCKYHEMKHPVFIQNIRPHDNILIEIPRYDNDSLYYEFHTHSGEACLEPLGDKPTQRTPIYKYEDNYYIMDITKFPHHIEVDITPFISKTFPTITAKFEFGDMTNVYTSHDSVTLINRHAKFYSIMGKKEILEFVLSKQTI